MATCRVQHLPCSEPPPPSPPLPSLLLRIAYQRRGSRKKHELCRKRSVTARSSSHESSLPALPGPPAAGVADREPEAASGSGLASPPDDAEGVPAVGIGRGRACLRAVAPSSGAELILAFKL